MRQTNLANVDIKGLGEALSSHSADTNHPIKLLLIEDCPIEALFLRESFAALTDGQITVCIRGNLKTGIALLNSEMPDIILLDLGLPDSHGLDGLLQIKTVAPDCPIIILTGSNDRALGLECIQSGAQDYLVKGSASAELIMRSIHYAIERKKVELLSQQTKALLEASNLKSAFVANISHELRTPLTGILGLNEILLLTDLNSEQREFAQSVQSCGHILLSIVSDLLDLSKIEAGKLSIETVPVDVRELVHNIVGLFAKEAEGKNLDLGMHIDDAIPPFLLGDPARLRQILLNLVGNSIKCTDRGEVVIEASIESSSASTMSIRFSVIDTGIGISEEEQHLLFVPFSQIKRNNTGNYQGTGLGLSICKHLIELMNGSISVHSQKGGGSTFEFKLPLGRDNRNAEAVVQISDNTNNIKSLVGDRVILVVEDNPLIQKLVEEQLLRLGFRAHVVSDGKAAIDAVKDGKFDLIIMDCQMPGMDGFEATKAIRELESNNCGNHIPIIAMTADAMTGDREKCILSGMDDYVSKPVSMDQLFKLLKHWLIKKSLPAVR